MLSKHNEATEVDCRTWLHVSSGTHWSTSSDTYQVGVTYKVTSPKMYKSNWVFLTLYRIECEGTV